MSGAPRGSERLDYTGLVAKLMWLVQAGTFDQPSMRALDPERMLVPGRVNVLDVSVANDIVKNLATADLLRKVFAYKVARQDAPPTLLVIEEAHSFISREKGQTMHATLQMVRDVARRGRKRWLSLAFVSQQPGHLPPEIFELCNTRLVHALRSMHNLDVLMATAGDVGANVGTLPSPGLRRSDCHVAPAQTARRGHYPSGDESATIGKLAPFCDPV